MSACLVARQLLERFLLLSRDTGQAAFSGKDLNNANEPGPVLWSACRRVAVHGDVSGCSAVGPSAALLHSLQYVCHIRPGSHQACRGMSSVICPALFWQGQDCSLSTLKMIPLLLEGEEEDTTADSGKAC